MSYEMLGGASIIILASPGRGEESQRAMEDVRL